MPAVQTLYDDAEMDVLVAWCERHGLDTLALFKRKRMPTMWRDGNRAWWVVPLPAGGEAVLVVHDDGLARN